MNKIESDVLAQTFYRDHSDNESDIFEKCENEDITISEASVELYKRQLSYIAQNDPDHSMFEIIHLLEVDDEYFVIIISDSVTDTIEQFSDLKDALECCKDYIEENFIKN